MYPFCSADLYCFFLPGTKSKSPDSIRAGSRSSSILSRRLGWQVLLLRVEPELLTEAPSIKPSLTLVFVTGKQRELKKFFVNLRLFEKNKNFDDNLFDLLFYNVNCDPSTFLFQLPNQEITKPEGILQIFVRIHQNSDRKVFWTRSEKHDPCLH